MKSKSARKIDRWHQTIVPPEKRPGEWSLRSGGSWDMYEIAPIPDGMLAELMQRHHTAGAPWNCRSLPLFPDDREYMFLLYYSMIGLVARMREAEKRAAATELDAARWRMALRKVTYYGIDKDFLISPQAINDPKSPSAAAELTEAMDALIASHEAAT